MTCLTLKPKPSLGLLPRSFHIWHGPDHTKTIVNANDSKRKLFYAFRPSVHTGTIIVYVAFSKRFALAVVCVCNRLRVVGAMPDVETPR